MKKKVAAASQEEIPKFKPPAPVVTLDKLISQEVLDELGIEDDDISDFMIALRFVTLKAEGRTTPEAAEMLGLGSHSLYSPKWKQLISSANRLTLSQMIVTEVQGVGARVFPHWGAIIDKQVSIAKSSRFDRDSTAAAEFLAEHFIDNAEKPADASAEQQYLKNRPNFAPVQINNITNNITQVVTPPEKPKDYVDAEEVSPDERAELPAHAPVEDESV